MKSIIEHLDIEGKDCTWYFNEYQMFNLLETKIMNQYVIEKWEGYTNINSAVWDHSTIMSILLDPFNHIINENVFSNLFESIFVWDKSNKTHVFKFKYWKTSMQFRYQIEVIFSVALICFF